VIPNTWATDTGERHRPRDVPTLTREVLRLGTEGLTRSDIAHVLKLSEAFVREVLEEVRP
jgi:DNA-binding NarL/FixJ family response regulator